MGSNPTRTFLERKIVTEEKLNEENLTEEEQKQLQELRAAWDDVVSSLEVTPVIYNDDGVPIWAGKTLKGKGCTEEADRITKEKLEDYNKRGESALADSEPLDHILKAGEVRFD